MTDPVECVYLIGNEANAHVKIGRSIDVRARLVALQAMSPVRLTLLWQTLGGAELEAALHRRFESRRMHGEWFDFPGCDPVDQIVRVLPEVTAKIQRAQRFGGTRTVARLDAELEATLPDDLREQWEVQRAKLDEVRQYAADLKPIEDDLRVTAAVVPAAARERILALATAPSGVANRIVAKNLDVSPATAHRYLAALGAEGLIEMRGRGRAAAWHTVTHSSSDDVHDDAE
jgi:hypothetical protein